MRAAPGYQSACGFKPPQPHTSFSPGTARPLRATRRRRSRQNKSGKSVRTRFVADLCSGCTLGSTSFLFSSVPLPSVYPPHFYYQKKGHISNNIPLHQAFFFHLPDGSFFAPNKRIFCHASYPARAFFGNAIASRYRESQFHPCPTMHLTLNVDSRVSDGLV